MPLHLGKINILHSVVKINKLCSHIKLLCLSLSTLLTVALKQLDSIVLLLPTHRNKKKIRILRYEQRIKRILIQKEYDAVGDKNVGTNRLNNKKVSEIS
jgi:hypothetical protein